MPPTKGLAIALAGLAAVACVERGKNESKDPVNYSPTIHGVPAPSVVAGSQYEFLPRAVDAEHQPLRYSIENKPSWAAFDATTGRLSGMPTEDDAGIYPGVVIHVSDGMLGASLPAFSILVDRVHPGAATVHWQTPIRSDDGSALRNLAGFRIHYGTEASDMNRMVDVPGARATRAVVHNLSPATWYFSVTSYTSDGIDSARSETMRKVVD